MASLAAKLQAGSTPIDGVRALAAACKTPADFLTITTLQSNLLDTGGAFLLDPLLHPCTAKALRRIDAVPSAVATAEDAIIKGVRLRNPRLREMWGIGKSAICTILIAATTQPRFDWLEGLCAEERPTSTLANQMDGLNLSAAESLLWGAFLAESADFPTALQPDMKGAWALWLLSEAADVVVSHNNAVYSTTAIGAALGASRVINSSATRDMATRAMPSNLKKLAAAKSAEALFSKAQISQRLAFHLADLTETLMWPGRPKNLGRS